VGTGPTEGLVGSREMFSPEMCENIGVLMCNLVQFDDIRS